MSKILIELSEHDKKVLSIVGHGPYGRDFVKIIDRVKDEVCSLKNIDRNRDTGPQVEGRLLLKDAFEELIKRMTHDDQAHPHRPPEDFE